MAQAVIEVRSLSHRFGARGVDRAVLHDVSFAVDAGEIALLTGRSGSGKSTLLTLLGGLRRVQSGEVIALGTDLAAAGNRTLARFRRRVRFVFQQHHLLSSLTALENVEAGLAAFGGDARAVRETSMGMLDAVGLASKWHARRTEMSGGEQQRVAIARALVSCPALLLADEPTAFLDGATGAEIVRLIGELAQRTGCTVLIATHDDRLTGLYGRRLNLEDGWLSEGNVRVSELLA
jgi:putative ABC transport system ATP-binding protein